MLSIDEAKTKIMEVAAKDNDFRELLIANPAEAVKRLFKLELPEGMRIIVHQESPDELHIVLPLAEAKELSQIELDAVSGGTCWDHEPPGNSCPLYDAT